MKKTVSILLAFIIAFSAVSVAFAEPLTEEPEICDGNCGCTPIVYIPGFGAGIYLNPESDDRTPIFPPGAQDIIKAVPDLLFAVIAIATGNKPLFGKMAVSAMNKLLGKLACDDSGKPVFESSIEPYEYPENDIHRNMTDDPTDRSFDFEYDWRLSPVDNAAELKKFIDHVKELTGHDEVSLICHSQGNTVVAAYLELYGNDGIEKIAFLSPAFQGISILGSLFRKEADLSKKSGELLTFVKTAMGESAGTDILSGLLGILNATGFTDSLLSFLQKYLTSEFDMIYAESLAPAFGNLAGIWSFVPDEYYDDAVNVMFEGRKDAPILEKIEYYHDNVMVKLEEILQNAMDNGTEIIICAGYGMSSIPVSLTPAVQSDSLIDTVYMSIGALCAPLGETLGDGYKQAVDCGHDHVSEDMLIDASTAAFPENTWFFKGISHSDFPDEYYKFINTFLLEEEEMNVSTHEEYPQFMMLDGDGKLIPVTKPEAEKKGFFGFFASLFSKKQAA